MSPQFHVSAASPGPPWWQDAHFTGCPDFHIRVSEQLGTWDNGWDRTWAEGRVQVLQEAKGSTLTEDSGDPGPQSEGTPEATAPTFGPGRSRCGINALGQSSLSDIWVSERLQTW